MKIIGNIFICVFGVILLSIMFMYLIIKESESISTQPVGYIDFVNGNVTNVNFILMDDGTVRWKK